MPHVSVIIPAYNPGRFLDMAVRSVATQTFIDWELIIIDDGGREDLSRIPEMDPRVRLVRQENKGTSVARNVGVQLSRGRLIAFLDHDDYWLPTKLELQVAAMDADVNVGLCYTNFEIVDATGRRTSEGYSVAMNGYLDLLSRKGGPCLSTAMIRKSCLMCVGLFDPMYRGIQDYDLFLKLARQYSMKFIPTCEVAYRLHEHNTSANYVMVYREIQSVAYKHWTLAKERGERDVMAAVHQLLRNARPTYGSQAFDNARHCAKTLRFSEFIVHFTRSLRLAPRHVFKSLFRHGCHILSLRWFIHRDSDTALEAAAHPEES